MPDPRLIAAGVAGAAVLLFSRGARAATVQAAIRAPLPPIFGGKAARAIAPCVPCPRNRSKSGLDPIFRKKLDKTFFLAAQQGYQYDIDDARRSTSIQQCLWGRGRNCKGKIVTKLDGVTKKSKHQSGKAVDVWPRDANGRRVAAKSTELMRRLKILDDIAKTQGLRSLGFQTLEKKPHCRDPKAGCFLDFVHLQEA